MSFSPESDRRAEALGAVALFVAAVLLVIVLAPPEGRVLTPLHGLLEALLGGTAFLLPISLVLVGGIALIQRARPGAVLPRQRLAGLGVLTVTVVVGEHLLGQSTGLIGSWFTGFLVGIFGETVTIVATLALIGLGVALAFNLKLKRRILAAR